jgi:peptidoglycan L-alanyl-D-glutamate endopeptidase CwlK
MSFRFGTKSEKEMIGVDAGLIRVVRRALQMSSVDFSVHDGLRTIEEQRALVKRGASWTMKSRHLEGKAVDLVPYVNGKLRWEWPLCFEIAKAMLKASHEHNVDITWGGVWDSTLHDILHRRKGESIIDLFQKEQDRYVKEFRAARRAAGKKVRSPHLDGPHFQIR